MSVQCANARVQGEKRKGKKKKKKRTRFPRDVASFSLAAARGRYTKYREMIHLHIIARIRTIIAELFNRVPGARRPKFAEIKRTKRAAAVVARARRNRAGKSLTIREIPEAPFAEYISDVPFRVRAKRNPGNKIVSR